MSNANNSANNTTPKDFVKHSDPIAINTSARRGRSVSVSSGSSSSPSEAQTPSPTSINSNRFVFPPTNNSPVLSYFLSQSPTKASGTFSLGRKFGPPPVFEDEESEIPVATHARRASTTVASRFSQTSGASIPEPQLERGSGLLRRLSLSSGAFAKYEAQQALPRGAPTTPPNSAVSPTSPSRPFVQNKPRRSATINEGVRPRRAPSPMGERILKGHFDGFN